MALLITVDFSLFYGLFYENFEYFNLLWYRFYKVYVLGEKLTEYGVVHKKKNEFVQGRVWYDIIGVFWQNIAFSQLYASVRETDRQLNCEIISRKTENFTK